jgi:hypothetical protein
MGRICNNVTDSKAGLSARLWPEEIPAIFIVGLFVKLTQNCSDGGVKSKKDPG